MDLLDVCINCGANNANVLDVAQIPFDESLRNYCEMNYCGSYGHNYACPPHVGNTTELIKEAKSYQRALVYQTVSNISDSFDTGSLLYSGVCIGRKMQHELCEWCQYGYLFWGLLTGLGPAIRMFPDV